jgi:hypothetical protein
LVDHAPSTVDRHPREPSAATALYWSAAGVNRWIQAYAFDHHGSPQPRQEPNSLLWPSPW